MLEDTHAKVPASGLRSMAPVPPPVCCCTCSHLNVRTRSASQTSQGDVAACVLTLCAPSLCQGEQVTVAMLDFVVAACCQVGDLARAFETFEVRMSWVVLYAICRQGHACSCGGCVVVLMRAARSETCQLAYESVRGKCMVRSMRSIQPQICHLVHFRPCRRWG